MKKYRFFFTSIFLLFLFVKLKGQDVIEVPKPEFSIEYLAVTKKAEQIRNQNPGKAANLLSEFLSRTNNPLEGYHIIFW